MTALTEFLYPTPARRTAGSIVLWWERRRLAYNAFVGTAGVFTLGAVQVVNWMPPGGIEGGLGLMWKGVLGYALLANVCYFLGPAAEIAIEKIGRGTILPTGPALYRMGLTFAVGLTLFPVLLALLVWVFRIVGAIAV